MTIRIGNVRNGDEGEYVGRRTTRRGLAGSVLANLSPVHGESQRKHSLERYRKWLSDEIASGNPDVLAELLRLRSLAVRPKGVVLTCWCVPKPCHASVIREALLADTLSPADPRDNV